ncbi:hypothetical protein MTBBW1_850059 [Desulfamplus magnetovallimortis]|uniref:Uncharacterized protein n=1 Tax=Desulfamplus magnetovallimortis TaxID=1246637 RepID=A0A1W1HKP7_9BACT|nr:hypothetical protein MTBBW1_850059 [Desulfamplus magnetovallimortis]
MAFLNIMPNYEYTKNSKYAIINTFSSQSLLAGRYPSKTSLTRLTCMVKVTKWHPKKVVSINISEYLRLPV